MKVIICGDTLEFGLHVDSTSHTTKGIVKGGVIYRYKYVLSFWE